jgi:pimeloyl-ACP methyl ester carboxylesterase
LPYRGFGGNPGTPSQSDLFDDALRLEQFVKAKHVRVDVLGRSLGTGVSVYVASKRRIDKLVLVTPYDSIANVAADKYPIFPVRWLLKDKYESVNYAPDVNAKIKIIVAGSDAVIPPKHALQLAQKFTQKPMLETILHEGHNSISSSSQYENAVCGFLR